MKFASILLSNVQTRMETFDGRKHLVVPVVALVEGVLNSLYYPADEIASHPQSWNGVPVVINHPEDTHGGRISANDPKILEEMKIGHFFNVSIFGSKLKGEAWIDVERAENIRPEILQEVHENLEVSTGLYGDSDNVAGTFNGDNYIGTLTGFKPDHLALLPESVGACDWQDGCGVRVNMEIEGDVTPFSERSGEEKRLIEDFNQRITSEDWEADYNVGTPHWMENEEPSPLAIEMVNDLRGQEITNAKILEIGVGNGRDSIFMAQSGNDVIGIDIVPSAVESARIKSNGMGGVSFQIGDAENLDFAAAEFDAVYSIAALHSTPLRFTLREIHRVLKNNGIAKLFLYTATKTGNMWVSYWTPGEIRQFAEEEGFTVLKFRERSSSEPIEIPGVDGLVEQESQQVITTLEKKFVTNKKKGGEKVNNRNKIDVGGRYKKIFVEPPQLSEDVLKAIGIEGEKVTGLFNTQFGKLLSSFQAAELGHGDIRQQLQRMADDMDTPGQDQRPVLHFVHEVFENFVIIRQESESGTKLFRIGFEVDDEEVVLQADKEEVREQTDFVPAKAGVGKQTTYIEVNSKKEDKVMADKCCKEQIDALIANKATHYAEEDRVWLDKLPEEQIKKLAPVVNEEPTAEEKATANAKVIADAVEAGSITLVTSEDDGEEEGTPATAEEYIANAPEGDMRDSLQAGLAMHKEKKASIITGLLANARNKFSKEQLEAKELTELENMAELGNVPVDYSLNNAAQQQVSEDGNDGDGTVIPMTSEVDWKVAAGISK